MSQDKLLYVIITIISFLALISYLASPVFQVHEININQLNYLNKEEIKEKLALFYRNNIWLIEKNKLHDIIKEDRYVKKVSINKEYPDKLDINVLEWKPLAKINNNGKFIVFGSDGIILEEGAMKTRAKVPLLKGAAYSFSGSKIAFPARIDNLLQGLEEISGEARSGIKNINLTDSKLELTLLTGEKVMMGDYTQLTRKFTVYASIYEKIRREELEVEYIDLRVVEKPTIR